MNRDSLAKSALLAWWALGKFAAKPYSTSSNFNLFSALSGLGLGAFRAVQGRLTEQSWIQREADPAGRWVERLRDELSTLTHQHTDPHQCWDREWDGQWRLLAFDIPAQPRHDGKNCGAGSNRTVSAFFNVVYGSRRNH